MKRFFVVAACILLASCASPSTSIPATTPSKPALEDSTAQPGSPFETGLPTETQAKPTSNSQRLLLIQYSLDGNQLVEYDLETGEARTLFATPKGSWLDAAMISPDGSQILLAYAPPPSDTLHGLPDLYLMPADGSVEPEVHSNRQDPDEAFFNPVWAPDGKGIYYTHSVPNGSGENQVTIERLGMDGAPEVLIENAFWPVVSPDGGTLAYLTIQPESTINALYLANADGSDQRPAFSLPEGGTIDAHLFTRDGSGLMFSMPNESFGAARSWWERILGIQVAFAHDVPSDWYRVSIAAGEFQRLTELGETGLAGDLSPDGKQLAFIGSKGLYLMQLDGGEPQNLAEGPYIGTVSWIP